MSEPDARVALLARDFDVTGLVALRHDVAHCAERNGLIDPGLYRFVVAVNEVTTNAVRHGGGSGTLELWRSGDRLKCRISDRGPGMNGRHGRRRTRPPVHAESGRGLWLVEQACEYTSTSDAGGTTVTLSCPAPGSPV